MTERDLLRIEIAKKRKELKDVEEEFVYLVKKDILLSDEMRQYKEELETVVVSKRPLKTRQDLVGRIYWIDSFKDEDSGESIQIQRSREVMRNGVFRLCKICAV